MANYSKACDHGRTGSSASRSYCLDCGEDVTLLVRSAEQYGEIVEAVGEQRAEELIVQDMGSISAAHDHLTATGSIAPIDTSQLGPVKIDYTRDQAMRDARALNWRRIDEIKRAMPLDRPFYVAWRTLGDRWSVERIAVRDTVPREATHWCDDLLGLPACSD